MSLPVNQSESLAPQQVWDQTMDELKLQMTKATFDTWLSNCQFIGHKPATTSTLQTFYIKAPNRYALDWIENRLNDTIVRTVGAICDEQVRIKFSIPEGNATTEPTSQSIPAQPEVPPPTAVQQAIPDITVQDKFVAKNNPTQGKKFQGTTPKTEYKPNGNEPVKISGRATDNPFDAGFVFVHNYALWFWRPYLGQRAFDLYLLLDSFYHEAVECDDDWPSIAKIARMLGHNRHAILGRKERAGRGATEGLVAILKRENICLHTERGEAEHKRTHHFEHLIRVRDLPLLTPAQVAKLPKPLQNDHKRWLKKHGRHFDLEVWDSDSRATRIEPFPLESED